MHLKEQVQIARPVIIVSQSRESCTPIGVTRFFLCVLTIQIRLPQYHVLEACLLADQ